MPTTYQVRIDPADSLRLQVSANGRYLQRAGGGAPFLLNQDAGWSMNINASDAGVETYFATRASQKFNGALIELIERDDTENPTGANYYGNTPFTGTTGGYPDFTTPREAFWARIDWILGRAHAHGIVPLVFPLYCGSSGGAHGWYSALLANGEARVRAYADFLAARYGAMSPIWMIGGDLSPTSTPTAMSSPGVDLLSALGNQLRANLPSAIVSAHWAGEDQGSSTKWGSADLHVLNGIYLGPLTHVEARADYDIAGPIPYFGLEHYYKYNKISGVLVTDEQVRRQSYEMLCSGGCGVSYGNEGVWYFGGNWYLAPSTDWQSFLGDASALDAQRLYEVFSTRPWHRLVPNGKGSIGTLITSGGGTSGTSNYVSAAATPEGDLLVAYVPDPHSGSVTIDVTKMVGTTRARWWDPRAGTFTTDVASPLANTGTHAFTIPGANADSKSDWMLVLESP